MKQLIIFSLLLLAASVTNVNAQKSAALVYKMPVRKMYIDVHHMQPGKVKYEDVAAAHQKDLAVQDKYGVTCIAYWVDEKNGNIYCLASAMDSTDIAKTHGEAHGLMPHEFYEVMEGNAAATKENLPFFLDIHQMGAGKVKMADVEKAHQKDLAVQAKYGVNCVNYWVDEKKGVIFCLAQASDKSKMLATHKEAHGLMPMSIVEVKPGK